MAKTIKKLKLTEVQRVRLRLALRESHEVLREIQGYDLSGEALSDMKVLEVAVQNIEVLVACN